MKFDLYKTNNQITQHWLVLFFFFFFNSRNKVVKSAPNSKS
uniref:Uncharacterized protein n=1 Tax=Anguilla anguilla TaxID=7936 RepID=A0A0E9XI17_ANGAN